MHYGSMPSIQVRNVPDDTHEVLRRRAAEDGRSLQEYLRHVAGGAAGLGCPVEVLADG